MMSNFEVYFSTLPGFFQFHKQVSTIRDNSNVSSSTIRTLVLNLPLGADVQVQLRARWGPICLEGFGLSTAILPETIDATVQRTYCRGLFHLNGLDLMY